MPYNEIEMTDEIFALSPLDGRYADVAEPLRNYFSEFAFLRDRVGVEVAYLLALSHQAGIVRALSEADDAALLDVLADFSPDDARKIRALEAETRHDVKAIEYFLRDKLRGTSRQDLIPYLHFGLTSEDVNQAALAFALLEAREAVLLPTLDALCARLGELAQRYRALPMLARTHGQAAVPTTLGKELANTYARLHDRRKRLAAHTLRAKLTGAVGNLNAHTAAAPEVNWTALGSGLLASLGLEAAPFTTQLMPYDNWIEYFQILALTNSILLDLAQDIWYYLSVGLLRLQTRADQVGSSTMPQKVNPIDFENAEGNLGVANALFDFYARKLAVSRLQRDLSDSTVRRTFGVALGHTLVAWTSLEHGLDLLEANEERLRAELDAHWETIAEGAQTILRMVGLPDAYERLKSLTRGRTLDRDMYLAWVDGLALPEAVRARLRALTPATYVGRAPELVDQILAEE